MKSRTRSKLAGLCCALAAACGTTTALAVNEVSVFIHYAGDAFETQTLHNAGAAISLSVSPRPSDGAVIDTIRITTIGTGDSTLDDIGLVTLTGTWAAGPVIDVIVAADSVISRQQDPQEALEAGARHWAGITASPDSGGNQYLRNAIRLSASVTGNITGTGGRIDVGQVFTLQAGSVEPPSTTSGNIVVPITVHEPSLGPLGESTRSVEFISAATSISGDIRVDMDPNNTTSADIVTVRCGPSPDAVGISGTIYTPTGEIREIRSSGPINITPSAGLLHGIEAYRGIGLIYCGVPSATLGGAPDPALPRSITADVACGISGEETVLELIQTAGDLKEPVHANTIGYRASDGTATDLRGIFVGGTIEQTIIVKDSVYLASIVGSTFAPGANITIARHLKGRIEATDSEDGVIRSVSVGHGGPISPESHHYSMNGWSVDDGDPESVIRATHIEAVDIAWMERNTKFFVPRIQAAWIGSLKVDRMTHGEVVGYAGPPAPEAAPTRANYARIDQATFGQVNQGTTRDDENGQHTSRIWCREFEQFSIKEGNAGQLRFVEIPENRSLQIGDGTRGLLDDGGSTGVYHTGLITIDASQLAVPEAPGLHGCIVLNANNAPNPDAEVFGAGDIRIYHSSQGYYEFNGTTASAEFKLPDYGHTSPSLGGGAIGLVPVTLQWQDCDQVGTQSQPARYLDSEFDRFLTDAGYPNGAKLRFYGPVTLPESPTLPPLRVFALINGAAVAIDSNVVFDLRAHVGSPNSTRTDHAPQHSTAAPLMPGSYLGEAR
jgi:hypothetical protein